MTTDNSLNSELVLRKLGRIEFAFDSEFHQHGSMILPRAFLVHLVDGFSIDLELIKRACVFWARRHPFLRAQVWRHENGREKYFVKLDQSEAFKFENVKLFEIDRHDDWLQLLDKDLAEEFPSSDRPLWTLKVIRIRSGVSAVNDFNYVFIFKAQHSITDGRNAFELLRQLLNIIAALIKGRVCAEMDEGVVEHSPLTTEDIIYKNKLDEGVSHTPNAQIDRVNRITSLFGNEEAQPANMFRIFCTNEHRLKRLFAAKIKANAQNAKLTSVLSTVVCLAFKNLYKKHKVSDIPLDKYQFSLMASLRDKLCVSGTQMGAYITAFDRVLFDDGDQLNLENIWTLSERESIELHQVPATNQDVAGVVFMDKIYDKILVDPNGGYTDKNVNFKISNIGQMKNTNADILRIKQCYVRTCNTLGRPGSNLLIGLVSVNGNLCWAFNYNERMMSSQIVLELIEEINSIIDKLID